jgi:xylulokinase
MTHLLGYDIGSSSIKATLLDSQSGRAVASATSPATELPIRAVKPGWAEQDPELWWKHVKAATAMIRERAPQELNDVKAIGIAYQMHGLVVVDKKLKPLRPSIIWCDSRAVEIGNKAWKEIGMRKCLSRLLNSPGNFTASKLKWVKQNEPRIYHKIFKAMLPGDFIAMRLSGEVVTTFSGLSEGIMWDYPKGALADLVLSHYGIDPALIAEAKPTFSVQGVVSAAVSEELGLPAGVKIAYRAGDQPNNAFSLGVLSPGEIAATAGTSAVVYGVAAKPVADPLSRVNTFVHVNHSARAPRYGVLLCINGSGILYSWLKHNVAAVEPGQDAYAVMDRGSDQVAAGADGLVVLPYGNGAERSLKNREIGASIHGLNFNIHTRDHLFRAAQEGVVFALMYGVEIMRGMGIEAKTVRAGDANMFKSRVFGQTFATVANATVALYNTDGSQGAARGAGIGVGIYASAREAFAGLQAARRIEPDKKSKPVYREAYGLWKHRLEQRLKASDH